MWFSGVAAEHQQAGEQSAPGRRGRRLQGRAGAQAELPVGMRAGPGVQRSGALAALQQQLRGAAGKLLQQLQLADRGRQRRQLFEQALQVADQQQGAQYAAVGIVHGGRAVQQPARAAAVGLGGRRRALFGAAQQVEGGEVQRRGAGLVELGAVADVELDVEQVAAHVYRLQDAKPHGGIAAYCLNHQIDYGFVPQGKHLSDFGLIVMDMDSTLISIECIDEIADMQGLKPQVAAITEAAMRGEIDFAESLRQRVALLEGLDEHALQRVYDERLQLNPGAEAMLAALKRHGIRTLLVSGGFVFFTERLKARLGLDFAHANILEIADGKLTGKVLGKIFDAQGKADWLVKIREELELKPEQVIAMGDGANDLKMLAQAGISVAYHAKPVVREQAGYALNFVGLDGLVNLLAH